MKPVFVEAVGLIGPGLPGWSAAQPVLRGECPYVSAEVPVHQPELLPANERRRATAAVRLAFAAAEDAMRAATLKPSDLASVFATSEADTGILHRLCTALAQEPRVMSPTDFHNSVHNAAAGYWSIATACRRPSGSISAYDATFVAGLLEAAALTQDEPQGALLVSYDIRPPEPLHAVRPIAGPLGAALLLTRERNPQSLAQLRVSITDAPESALEDGGLERLRLGNPAARALPLLRLLALRKAGAVVMPGAGSQRYELLLSPC